MSDADANQAGPQDVNTLPEAETIPRPDADTLAARAARIRARSQELIDEPGVDHPLVAQAIERAEALERESSAPGEIHLR